MPGPELTDAAREAAAGGADVVVMAGGDGTMSAGAAALAGGGHADGRAAPRHAQPLRARPRHPRGPRRGACASWPRASCGAVDVGEANGRVFLNNASIGLYPHAVLARETQQDEQGTGKWLAMGRAALDTLRRFPVVRVTLHLPTGRGARHDAAGLHRQQPLRDDAARPRASGRRSTAASSGSTSPATAGRIGFVRLALRALVGRLDQARDFLGVARARGDRSRTAGAPSRSPSTARCARSSRRCAAAVRPRALPRDRAPPPP